MHESEAIGQAKSQHFQHTAPPPIETPSSLAPTPVPLHPETGSAALSLVGLAMRQPPNRKQSVQGSIRQCRKQTGQVSKEAQAGRSERQDGETQRQGPRGHTAMKVHDSSRRRRYLPQAAGAARAASAGIGGEAAAGDAGAGGLPGAALPLPLPPIRPLPLPRPKRMRLGTLLVSDAMLRRDKPCSTSSCCTAVPPGHVVPPSFSAAGTCCRC
jgi:hypothetical protein